MSERIIRIIEDFHIVSNEGPIAIKALAYAITFLGLVLLLRTPPPTKDKKS